MDEIDKANILTGCDSFSELEDRFYFKEEYTELSLEEKLRQGIINGKTYDIQRKLKDLE